MMMVQQQSVSLKTSLIIGATIFVVAVALLWFKPAIAAEVMVYKNPQCGCCNDWVKHLEAEGFEVKSEERTDMVAIKAKYGVTDKLASCHTALIDGYVIEGHVPASDVKRLLKERPDVVGLTAPGMPMKSPGMQPADKAPKGYDVLSFDQHGKTKVYAHY